MFAARSIVHQRHDTSDRREVVRSELDPDCRDGALRAPVASIPRQPPRMSYILAALL